MSKKHPNPIEAGLKVGDSVDGIRGEMIITSITSDPIYKIRAENKGYDCSFDEYGYSGIRNAYPSIWFKSDTDWFNPPMSPPEPDHAKEFYTDRPVWVRDDDSKEWNARYAGLYLPTKTYKFMTFYYGEKQADATGMASWHQVSYTKPEGAEDHE